MEVVKMGPKQKPQKQSFKNSTQGNESGIILIAVVMIIVILALVGTIAVITTSTDLKISQNYKTNVQSFYAANAGMEEARERLRKPSTNTIYAGDPSDGSAGAPYFGKEGNDPLWVTYIASNQPATWDPANDDPDYDNVTWPNEYYPVFGNPSSTALTNNNSLQNNSSIPFWTKTRHKRRSDLEGYTAPAANTYTEVLDVDIVPGLRSADDIIYYGYTDVTSLTLKTFTSATPNTNICSPVEIIKAYGSSLNSTNIIEIQGRKAARPPVPGTFYGYDTTPVSGGGSGNVDIIGDDNCTGDYVPAVAYANSDDLSTAGGAGDVCTNSCTDHDAAASQQIAAVDIDNFVDLLEPLATEVLIANDNNYIGDSNDYKITYCDASLLGGELNLSIKNNEAGYGTLIVRGNLKCSGNFLWYGLIIVTGNVRFTGGGATRYVYGAVLAGGTASTNGTMTFQYDSCQLNMSNQSYTYTTFRWVDRKLDPN